MLADLSRIFFNASCPNNLLGEACFSTIISCSPPSYLKCCRISCLSIRFISGFFLDAFGSINCFYSSKSTICSTNLSSCIFSRLIGRYIVFGVDLNALFKFIPNLLLGVLAFRLLTLVSNAGSEELGGRTEFLLLVGDLESFYIGMIGLAAVLECFRIFWVANLGLLVWYLACSTEFIFKSAWLFLFELNRSS